LIDTKDQLRLLQRSTLKEFTIQKKSGMPSFKDKLSAQELSDVVAYLTTLRGSGL
jgi:mono/diheme cytochrome c family protein